MIRVRPVHVCVFVLVARLAAAAPESVVSAGTTSPFGLPFSGFPAVTVDAADRVIFVGTSTGVFRRAGAALARVIVAGDVIPSSGRFVAGVGAVALGPSGCIAVRVSLVGGGAALLRRCPTGVETALETGTAVPGGGIIGDLLGPVAAGGPHLAFGVRLDDGRTALLRLTGTTLTRIVTTGDPSPTGGTFSSVRLVGVSAAGRVGFRGSVSAGHDGLFAGDGGRPLAIVRVGDAVGGQGLGGAFSAVGGASLNEADRWAFRGTVDAGSGVLGGVFAVDAADVAQPVSVIAVEGGLTPTAGVTFRGFPASIVPSINADGAIAFRATLTGAEGGSAIFVAPPGEPLVRIVATRDRTEAGALVRFRDPVIADDGSLCIPASRTGFGPGLYVYRGGTFLDTPLAELGDRTDVDTGSERFRFFTPSVRATAEDAVFLGSRDGVFRAEADGTLDLLAYLGQPTPIGGVYAGFDTPSAGARTVAFGAEIREGRASRALVRIAADGTPRVVAAATARSPGGGRFVDFFAGAIDSLERADLSPHDEVLFEATMQGGRFARGLFRGGRGRVHMIAASGRRAPGGGTYQSFGTPVAVRGPRSAFVAVVEADGGRVETLVLAGGGGGTRLARQGELLDGRVVGHVNGLEPPDASDRLVVWRATLAEQAREALMGYDVRRKARGLVVGTGDPSPDGPAFRTFERPIATGADVAFLGRLQGSPQPAALYLARLGGALPAGAPPAIERLLGPGTPTLGGTIGEVLGVDANRAGVVVSSVELVGASAPAAILRMPTVP